jgi:hypothetical protein
LEKAFDELNFFEGKLRGETLNFVDNRFYSIDSEELFEIGGLTNYLKIVKPTFEKLGLKLNYSNEKSSQTKEYWKHTIELNGKEYVGLTKRTIDSRWKQHIQESLRLGSWEYNTPLGNAIKKYGKDSFDISILKECGSILELKEEEKRFISVRKSLSKYGGYNLTEGGDGRFGYKLSE